MKNVVIVNKYLALYRHAVFNELSLFENPKYTIVADIKGREGIETIPWSFAKLSNAEGGITWEQSKSYYYYKSLQYFQSNVISKIFSKKYDLFILDGATSHFSTWLFAILAKIANKRTIFWSHGFKGTDKGAKKLIRFIFFKYLPDGLILYGDFSKKIMVNEGFNPNKIVVIGNSLNYQKQRIIRDKLLKDEKGLVLLKNKIFNNTNKTILFIGRLQKNKKVEKLINSLKELNDQGLKLNCIIIGNGPEEEYLSELVDKFGLNLQVYFAGALYNEEEIAKLFLISDLMVSPGNVGLNCIHSLSYGIPVLTHNNFSFQNPEVESIIPNKNGLFYNYNDFTDMTLKIKLWFSKGRMDTFNNCIEIIETKFNPSNHAHNINQAVLKVIGKK